MSLCKCQYHLSPGCGVCSRSTVVACGKKWTQVSLVMLSPTATAAEFTRVTLFSEKEETERKREDCRLACYSSRVDKWCPDVKFTLHLAFTFFTMHSKMIAVFCTFLLVSLCVTEWMHLNLQWHTLQAICLDVTFSLFSFSLSLGLLFSFTVQYVSLFSSLLSFARPVAFHLFTCFLLNFLGVTS